MKIIKILKIEPNRHRAEGRGFIRWFINNECVLEITTDEYYQGQHVHSSDCSCNALVHDKQFREKLREKGFIY